MASERMRFRVAGSFTALAARLRVGEALAGLAPPDAGLLVRDVDETGGFGRLAGVDDGA